MFVIASEKKIDLRFEIGITASHGLGCRLNALVLSPLKRVKGMTHAAIEDCLSHSNHGKKS